VLVEIRGGDVAQDPRIGDGLGEVGFLISPPCLDGMGCEIQVCGANEFEGISEGHETSTRNNIASEAIRVERAESLLMGWLIFT